MVFLTFSKESQLIIILLWEFTKYKYLPGNRNLCLTSLANSKGEEQGHTQPHSVVQGQCHKGLYQGLPLISK